MTTATASSELTSILQGHEKARSDLIPILQDVQQEMGYLSEDAVAMIADHLDLSPNDVFGVATFYTQFRFTAPGKHCIKVCQGTACHVQGSGLIIEELSRKLNVLPGGTTEDQKFSLERVACYGSCALAPVVVIDEKVHDRMSPKKTLEVIEEFE